VENLELYKKIEEKIALCGQQYAENEKDPFLSVSKASELKALKNLYDRIRNEEMPTGKEQMLAELAKLRERTGELEKEMEREECFPTFDWYDEHHYYKVFLGQREAYRSVTELLEQYIAETENKAGRNENDFGF